MYMLCHGAGCDSGIWGRFGSGPGRGHDPPTRRVVLLAAPAGGTYGVRCCCDDCKVDDRDGNDVVGYGGESLDGSGGCVENCGWYVDKDADAGVSSPRLSSVSAPPVAKPS